MNPSSNLLMNKCVLLMNLVRGDISSKILGQQYLDLASADITAFKNVFRTFFRTVLEHFKWFLSNKFRTRPAELVKTVGHSFYRSWDGGFDSSHRLARADSIVVGKEKDSLSFGHFSNFFWIFSIILFNQLNKLNTCFEHITCNFTNKI